MSASVRRRTTADRPPKSSAGSAEGEDSTRPGVVDKVASLLVALAAGGGKALDLGDIVAHTGINKSTACRILKRLAVHRLVDQDPNTGAYRLGLAFFELGRRAGNSINLAEIATPFLESLAEETGETAHFAILDTIDGAVVHLARAESPHPVRAVPSQTGEEYPFHCLSVGKLLVAHLPDAERRPLLARSRFERFTERTLTRREDLEREFETIRRDGYAVDDEEYYEGIRCVAVPVIGDGGVVLGGLSLAGPAHRVTRERVEELAVVLARAATRFGRSASPAQGPGDSEG